MTWFKDQKAAFLQKLVTIPIFETSRRSCTEKYGYKVNKKLISFQFHYDLQKEFGTGFPPVATVVQASILDKDGDAKNPTCNKVSYRLILTDDRRTFVQFNLYQMQHVMEGNDVTRVRC